MKIERIKKMREKMKGSVFSKAKNCRIRGTLRKEGAPSGFSILIKYCCVNAV